MKFSPKQRFAAFALAVIFASVTIGWALHRAWRIMGEVESLSDKFRAEAGKDEKGLADIQEQYSRIAEYVPKELEELNESLLAFTSRNDQRVLANYQRKSEELTAWIRQQEASVMQGELILYTEPNVFRANVKQLVQNINHVYREYLVSAQQLIAPPTPPADHALKLMQFAAVQKKSQQILALANRAQAQSEAIKLSVFSSKEPFQRMQDSMTGQIQQLHRRLILASVASAIGLCAVFLVVIYRLWISPLHLKLLESDATIERQAKLAKKGQTASELAHEIRNPLAAINFRLYALQKVLSAGGDEHRDAAAIRKEVRRLNAILEDFLQLDHSPRPEFITIAAEDALREARDLMAPQLEAQQIEVKLVVAGNPQVETDVHLLQQVLINLIKNSAESIGHNGVITLLARPDQVSLRRHPTAVVIIEVSDTGPGIPPEVQERLFDPFFTTKKGGTGLGLSIVERIVEKHGGVLDFETTIGAGTKFRIVLPVEQANK